MIKVYTQIMLISGTVYKNQEIHLKKSIINLITTLIMRVFRKLLILQVLHTQESKIKEKIRILKK